jgi:small subunit ribosomal protein S17
VDWGKDEMAERKKKKAEETEETSVEDHVDSADAESTTPDPEPDDTPVAKTEPTADEPEPSVEVAAAAEVDVTAATEPVAADPEPDVSETESAEPAATPEASASAPAEAPEQKRKKKRLPRAERPARTKRKKVAKPAARKPIVRLEKPEHERGRRQERQGTVVSNAMDKTIVVKVDTLKAHRKYEKVVRRSNTFHAHDEANQANVGDVVRIVETRPLSKMKRWRLAEIVEAAK